MKKILSILLGILTALGGFVEIGDLVPTPPPVPGSS
jgi:hypothetical protein